MSEQAETRLDGLAGQPAIAIRLIAELFLDGGTWPLFAAVDRRLDRDFGIDAQEALDAVPAELMPAPIGRSPYRGGDEIQLTIRGLSEERSADSSLEDLVSFVGFVVAEERTYDPGPKNDPLRVSDEQAAQWLSIDSSTARGQVRLRALMKLAVLVPGLTQGSSISSNGDGWQLTIGRGARKYRGLTGLRDLVGRIDTPPDARYSSSSSQQSPDEILPSALSSSLDPLVPVLRQEIVSASQHPYSSGDFDGAIFAAMKVVEDHMQRRIGSQLVGDQLVNTSFQTTPPRIRISSRPMDAQRAAQLLSGSLGLYKGDRSHKARPSLPVHNWAVCLRILALASALLDLLDRDFAVAPMIVGYRHLGSQTLELWVERAGLQPKAWIDGAERPIVSQRSETVLLVDVRGVPPGEHELFTTDATRHSSSISVFLNVSEPDANWYRVVAVDVPTSDAAGNPSQSPGSIRLLAYEGGTRTERIVPTLRSYRVGDYVTWDWDLTQVIGERWTGTGEDRGQVWESSALFAGVATAAAHPVRLSSLSLEPARLLLRPGESVPVRVMGRYTDGVGHWTDEARTATIVSADEKVAAVAKGTVYAKRAGRVELKAKSGSHFAPAVVEVAAHPTDTVSDLLTDLPAVAGVAWANDQLIVSCRTPELLAVRGGKVVVVASIPRGDLLTGGTDTIAASLDGSLAVRTYGLGDALILDAASAYGRSQRLSLPDAGSVMAFAWEGLELYAALHTGAIWHVGPHSPSTLMMTLPSTPVSMSWSPQGMLVMTTETNGAKHLWLVDRTQQSRSVDLLATVSGANVNNVLWARGRIYLTDFSGGRVLTLDGDRLLTIAKDLQNPSEMTVGSDGTIYVAEFGRRAVRRIMP